MAILKEISAVVGKYTNKDGVEKNQYVNMGKIISTKNGHQMIKIDSIPVNWDGWAYLNDPREKTQSTDNSSTSQSEGQETHDGDSIPF